MIADAINPWALDANTQRLYRDRAKGKAPIMDCHVQAAALVRELVGAQADCPTILDVGCASGYFVHALRREFDGKPFAYHGVDMTISLILMAREEMARHGCGAHWFQHQTIEGYRGRDGADVVCVMNTLTFEPCYLRPLHRALQVAKRGLILRESMLPGPWEVREYEPTSCAPGAPRSYCNTYDLAKVRAFVEAHGFDVTEVQDERTKGQSELTDGKRVHWRWLVGRRRGS